MSSRASRVAVTLLLGTGAPLAAQPLPSADEVIETYVEAIGGRDAHVSPVSIRSAGTIEMPAMGMRGEFEVLQLLPDQMLTRISLPGVGEILSGYDGRTGWTVNPLSGAMLMTGQELAQTRERAQSLASLRDSVVVPERETVGLTEYGGESCWKVRLIWVSGRESFDCYSGETGLLIASEDSQASMMGEVPVTTRFSDYQEFHGMVLPTRLVQTALGQVQEMLVREVEVDSVDPASLDPPSSIKTLLADPDNR